MLRRHPDTIKGYYFLEKHAGKNVPVPEPGENFATNVSAELPAGTVLAVLALAGVLPPAVPGSQGRRDPGLRVVQLQGRVTPLVSICPAVPVPCLLVTGQCRILHQGYIATVPISCSTVNIATLFLFDWHSLPPVGFRQGRSWRGPEPSRSQLL